MFSSAGCSLLGAESFFHSLDVLYGALGKGKLQFLIKKYLIFFTYNFFSILVVKTLDPDPDRYSA